MSYLTQQFVGFNLNNLPGEDQAFRLLRQETPPESFPLPLLDSFSPSAATTTNNENSSCLKRRLPVTLPANLTPCKCEERDYDEQEPGPNGFSLHDGLHHQEKKQKQEQEQEQEDIHYTLSGFSKIPLPTIATTSTPLHPPASARSCLRRTVSDFHGAANGCNVNDGYCTSNSFQGISNQVSPGRLTLRTNNGTMQSPMMAAGDSCGFVQPGSSLPPLPPLQRTLSDPTPSPSGWFLMAGGDGEGIGAEQSPNSVKLKRMKLRLREMSQWWEQVLREAEEEEGHGHGHSQQCHNKNNITAKAMPVPQEEEEGAGNRMESETQEAVSVEKLGDCLSIHFNCPCNKGYQILLAGKNCYYKLV